MDIALIGKAGAGKDAAAAHLVAAHGYTRLAFADPLKEMALRVDPIVYVDYIDGQYFSLSEEVHRFGWDGAKSYPEVRRLLQQMGQSVRDHEPDFWFNVAMRKWAQLCGPVVFTDCRYLNEADGLRRRGYKIVRIVRPDSPSALSGAAAAHSSEVDLDDYPDDATIVNDGSLAQLALRVSALLG